ncbi:hypothetical protein GY45DRAFT_816467 [Cubamyces sp. BRFM 1775]|nr:hypothetical protein GY45DRAFT_816467 [Cubamyces sp. BRFM 1775]
MYRQACLPGLDDSAKAQDASGGARSTTTSAMRPLSTMTTPHPPKIVRLGRVSQTTWVVRSQTPTRPSNISPVPQSALV